MAIQIGGHTFSTSGLTEEQLADIRANLPQGNLVAESAEEAENNGKALEDAGLSGDEWFALAEQMQREMDA